MQSTFLSSARRRPFWVWVISLLYFFTGTRALLLLLRILGMDTAVDETQATALLEVKKQLLLWSMYGLIPAANLAGGVLLFKLHRWAYYCFALILSLNLVNMVRSVLFDGGAVQLTSGSSVVGVLLGLGVIFAVCVYTYRLKENGILT